MGIDETERPLMKVKVEEVWNPFNGTWCDPVAVQGQAREVWVNGAWVGENTPFPAPNYERFVDSTGKKRYELSNHLGNVLAVVSDRKLPQYQQGDLVRIAYYEADQLSLKLYDPFGTIAQEWRITGTYRYSFNGKESDSEWDGGGAMFDYGFRIYDPRLGRFLSVDPLTESYPWYTPYQFAGNMPIWAMDMDGAEPFICTPWVTDFWMNAKHRFDDKGNLILSTIGTSSALEKFNYHLNNEVAPKAQDYAAKHFGGIHGINFYPQGKSRKGYISLYGISSDWNGNEVTYFMGYIPYSKITDPWHQWNEFRRGWDMVWDHKGALFAKTLFYGGATLAGGYGLYAQGSVWGSLSILQKGFMGLDVATFYNDVSSLYNTTKQGVEAGYSAFGNKIQISSLPSVGEFLNFPELDLGLGYYSFVRSMGFGSKGIPSLPKGLGTADKATGTFDGIEALDGTVEQVKGNQNQTNNGTYTVKVKTGSNGKTEVVR